MASTAGKVRREGGRNFCRPPSAGLGTSVGLPTVLKAEVTCGATPTALLGVLADTGGAGAQAASGAVGLQQGADADATGASEAAELAGVLVTARSRPEACSCSAGAAAGVLLVLASPLLAGALLLCL